MTVYDFKAPGIDGKERALAEYRGKPLLIVNVASKCGFTPQYQGLEALYQKYKDRGFVVLGFPCNQFGGQEPGSAKDISEFCELNFGVKFPLFQKVDVNGPSTHPLYEYLKREQPGFLFTKRIKWNFTKFLVDRAGKPVKRYGSTTKPEAIERDVEKVLGG